MDRNNILEMRNITKVFPGVKALDDVDFSVRRGEVHCLIGANGAGKSTLMKVLSGAYVEDKGTIFFDNKQLKSNEGTQERRKAGIAIIYQELSLFNELTVGENVFINNYPKKGSAVDWKKLFADTQALADSLNIRINAKSKVSELNVGQRQLTEIMKALACNAKLIVMDEPSSTLSGNEFEILVKVIQDLKAKGITIIYISHHLEELFIVGDRVTVMRDGRFVVCRDTAGLDEKQLVGYMTGVTGEREDFAVSQTHMDAKDTILELRHLSNYKVHDINIQLHKGEVVGLYGLIGAGRTELLQSIFGVAPITEGELLFHGKKTQFKNTREAIRHGIGLTPENRKLQGLVLKLPVWENMSMVALSRFVTGGKINYKKIQNQCSEYVEKMRIKTPDIDTISNNLSGGNQQKVILAKWMIQECDILLMDEPTQGIDVMAKAEIYELIGEMTAAGKSVIVVSSELNELLRVCDTIHVLYDGRQVMSVGRESFHYDRIQHASVVGREVEVS